MYRVLSPVALSTHSATQATAERLVAIPKIIDDSMPIPIHLPLVSGLEGLPAVLE